MPNSSSDRAASGKADSPHVRVPPPLYYVAGFLTGFALTRRFPTPWLPERISEPIALVLLVASAALGLWSVLGFWRARTSVLPHRPATAFVARGPYRYTRNPMYVAMAMLYVGLALMTQAMWALLLLPLVLLAIEHHVIAREEAYLERRFGDEYLRYQQRVRRWL